MLLTTRITHSPKSREVNLSSAFGLGLGVWVRRSPSANSVSRMPLASLRLLDGVVSRKSQVAVVNAYTENRRHSLFTVFNFRLVQVEDAVAGGRLCPRCRHLANSTKHTRRLWFCPFALFCENMMLSTPEILNALHLPSEEDRATFTDNKMSCTKNLVKDMEGDTNRPTICGK